MRTSRVSDLATKHADGWTSAARIDATLECQPRGLRRLDAHLVEPRQYSRKGLFDAMAQQRVGLFYGSGAGIKSGERLLGLIESLRSERRSSGRFGVWLEDKRVQMGVDDIFERWVSGEAPVSVADLHFRDTPFEHRVKGAEVDSINLLRSKHEEIARQEMM